MKKYFTGLFFMLVLMVAFNRCTDITTLAKIVKTLPNDPFRSTITPSQEFSIDAKKDNVVEGKNGTIAVFPKGCFKNAKGEIVEGNVKVELTEALSISDMLLSNLTTVSNGKPLVTGGMLYFNATLNGEQLTVNKDNPVHFEVPTTHKLPGMMAYKGIRDSNGNMNWVEPKELDKFLVPVDIKQLNFLPDLFAAVAESGMPYKNHKTTTPELVDSLYYMLSATNGSELVRDFVATCLNEPYYNKNSKVVNGKYTDDSYKSGGSDSTKADTASAPGQSYGIDPAIIKVIKSEKYQNTLIATREFEERLRFIFQTCDNNVIEIYIKHLNKNMYELDSMAAQELGGNEHKPGDRQEHLQIRFKEFADQRLTNVKDAGKYAALLKDYYDGQLTEVKKELADLKEKMQQVLDKENGEAQKLADEYKAVLMKRETYRMETYGFNWTETGWVNIDNGTIPKTWGPQPLAVTVENGKQYDRVYTYIIYLQMKSLYRLNTTDNVAFNGGNDANNAVLMPKASPAVLISIGYTGETPSIALQEIITGSANHYSLALKPVTIEKLRETIAPFENKYLTENSIGTDLQYMLQLYKEENRQKALQKESEFFLNLCIVAFPCGNFNEYVSEADTVR